MRLRLSLLTLFAMLFCLFNTAFAQNQASVSDTDLINQIREEIRIESDMFKSNIKEAKAIQERITALKNSGKPNARLRRFIETNNVDSLQAEFNKYAKRIDNALLRNPDDAEKLIATTRSLFGGVAFLKDDIDYYDGALLFYRKADIRVVSHFVSFLAKYNDSNVRPNALALYLRSMINLNYERQADEQYTKLYSTLTSNEITYLLGHIKFSLALDAEATLLFTQLSDDPRYGTDSKLMLEFIAALSGSIPNAINKFKNLDGQYSNNPFIILALARMYVNSSEWKLAEDHYKRFYTLVNDYREINSQYELVLAYLNSGERARANQLLDELLQRKDLGSYYPTLLYLWADLKAEDGNYDVALNKFDDFISFSDEAKNTLMQKKAILDKIEALKTRLYQNPSETSYQQIKTELLALSDELAMIHQKLMAKSSVISSDVAEQLYKYEIQTILHYKSLFDNYVASNKLRNYPDKGKIAIIEAQNDLYVQDEKAFEIIQALLDKIISENYEYQRHIALQEDINVSEDILSVIQQIKLQTSEPAKLAELETKEAEYSAKISENKQLLEYYAFDNTLSTVYKESYEEFQAEKKVFEELYPALIKAYTVTIPNKIANREMALLKKEIDSYDTTTSNYTSVVNSLINSLNKSEISIDFVRLQMAYKDIDYRSQQHDKIKNTMEYEQSAAINNSFREERIALRDRYTSFLQRTPKFKYLQQPGGSFLISEANLFYNMAELSYAIDINNPQLALDYYTKTNEADPNFYMRDAVLYNIGYIHSTLTKGRIDRLTDSYFTLNPTDYRRPESIRLNEENLSQTLNAYKEIADNYTNSRYYDEVILRLGIIYFNLGADAAEPAIYYAKAKDYFNMLISKDGSRYQYDALYQRGWVNLNGNDEKSYQDGLNDFVSILKAINDGKITNETDIDDYTLSAIKNIAYCLVALDRGDYQSKPLGTEFVISDLAKTTSKDVLFKVIDNAVAGKFELDAPMQAADFMRLKITVDPLALDNPTLLDSVFAIYVKYQNQLRPGDDIYALRDSIYMEMKTSYNAESAWYAANKDKQIDPQLLIIRKAYDSIDLRLYNNFYKNPNALTYAAYNKHIVDYSKYTALLGDSVSVWVANKAQLKATLSTYLAEKMPTIANYMQAVGELHWFNEKYPDNSDFFVNEGLAFQYSEMVFNKITNQDSTAVQTEVLPQELATPESLFAFYSSAADRYMTILLSDKFTSKERKLDYITIQRTLSQLEYQKKMYSAAKQRYMKILELPDGADNATIRDTYLKLAQIAIDEQNYTESENWYRKAEPLALSNADRTLIQSNVQVQIQSSIEQATNNKDYGKVALENMRLAGEFEKTEPARNLKYRIDAYSAYREAGNYQMAINVLKDLAIQTNDVTQAFDFYRTAWVISDSLMTDAVQTNELKTAFMDRFPSSNQTFNLRLREIVKLAENPSNKDRVSELYLGLYNDVKNNAIVANADTPLPLLYRSAINVYIPADSKTTIPPAEIAKRESLMRSYIALYPKDSFAGAYLEIIMLDSYNSGDTAKYEQVAKEIYTSDKTKYQAYQSIAEAKLTKILDTYIAVYTAKDWKQIFATRDEYNKVEANFVKEGLTFDHATVKVVFADHLKEYNKLQERIAFLKNYDKKLDAYEAAIKANQPDKLIRVNNLTNWGKQLVGGKDNRVAAYKKSVDESTLQIQKYLASITEQELDNERVLRGYNIIARMYEYSGVVIKTQIDRYFAISKDLNAVKIEDADYYNQLINNFMLTRDQHVNDQISKAASWQKLIYDNYIIPGYKDKYTEYCMDFFNGIGGAPQYAIENMTFDASWSAKLVSINDGGESRAFKNSIQPVVVNQLTMGSTIVPAGMKLVLNKSFSSRIKPLYGIVNYVSSEPVEINVNGKVVESYSDIAVDTLNIQNAKSTRFAATVVDNWDEANNAIGVTYTNSGTQPATIALGFQLVNDQRGLFAATPTDIIENVTDASWTIYYTDPTTNKAVISKAVLTDKLGVSVSNIEGLSESSAKAIWVPEQDSLPISTVTFETQINIDTEFRAGKITFVAPTTASIFINGVPVLENQELAYIDDPLEMYPISYEIDKAQLVPGVNKIQIQVKNNLPYRGFVANIRYEKNQKR
ncbi:MAG: hypothetical protein CVU48_00215 [Candidatus Cloacimonetes bacterium HGW-Cloacimonetes-1]|jgi:hypothetical protein|nr:MAG: hypothetical protein CVU48_00215 [Candidatus Cloacimonetes bacterium HGW-Cloacimonetes-1]